MATKTYEVVIKSSLHTDGVKRGARELDFEIDRATKNAIKQAQTALAAVEKAERGGTSAKQREAAEQARIAERHFQYLQQLRLNSQRMEEQATRARVRNEERAAKEQQQAWQRAAKDFERVEREQVKAAERAARERTRADERAAKEIARINAQTARDAHQQEKLRERAAKSLADVQTREARRAANDFLKSEHLKTDAATKTASGASSIYSRYLSPAFFTTLGIGAALGLAAGFKSQIDKAIDLASALRRQVANIKSIKPEIDMSQVTRALNEMQTRVPQTAEQLADALYDVFSSIEVSQEQGLQLVEKFARGATAAVTDTKTFGTAVIGVMAESNQQVREKGSNDESTTGSETTPKRNRLFRRFEQSQGLLHRNNIRRRASVLLPHATRWKEAHCKTHRRTDSYRIRAMIKMKVGAALRSKTKVGQSNEALCKVLCLASVALFKACIS